MPFGSFNASCPPVDAELVDKIVSKLKSQGIFDQFRKDCLADVDTKPAYQNLQQRVNGTVATFLATQQWQPDLNKIQLRESLRRHVQQGFLEVGVDRIVDQVVNPKIVPLFMPRVEDVVCECLGIEKPKIPLSATFSTQFLTSFPPPLLRPKSTSPCNNASDLLPKDLDPVSPESDHGVCLNGSETPLKDERNNNEVVSPKDEDGQDSQLSGISDLSSHLGDCSNRENPAADSNTVKSITSPKPDSFQFDNFTNLTEKIKQAEMAHGQVSGVQADLIRDDTVPEELSGSSPKEVKDENKSEETRYESISTNSLSTFEDSKTFVSNKLFKDEACSQTCSNDSISSSLMNREKVELCLSKPAQDSESSNLIIETDNSLLKDSLNGSLNEIDEVTLSKEDSQIEKPVIKKDNDRAKDKKSRESSSSSKHSRSNDKHRHSSSKDRSNRDKRDDKANEIDKLLAKEDKIDKTKKEEKQKSSEKDDKHRSTQSSSHRNEKHASSVKEGKDKFKKEEKEKSHSKEKENAPKKEFIHKSSQKDDKVRHKDEKNPLNRDRINENDRSSDRNKESDSVSRKETKTESKDLPGKESKYEKESGKDKEKSSESKCDNDKDKEQAAKSKRDYDKEKRVKSDKDKVEKESKSSEKDKHDKDKHRYDKEKHEKDKERSRKDKERRNKSSEKYSKSDEKAKDSRSHEKPSTHSSSSSKKADNQDKKSKPDDSSSSKIEEERKERKRKRESCNSELKMKDGRRSSDRDSSGSKGGTTQRTPSDNKSNSSSQNTKHSSSEKKSRGSTSNETGSSKDQSEKMSLLLEEGSVHSDQSISGPVDPVSSGPSEVELILSRLNSSIEEIENSMNKDFDVNEVPRKKPKIAKNFAEVRKIMQERKKFKIEIKGSKDSNELNVEKTDTPQTCDEIDIGIPEENKENIKSSEYEKTKNFKSSSNKTEVFSGFNDTETVKTVTNFLAFERVVGNYDRKIDYINNVIEQYNQHSVDNSEEFLDNNLNKLKPITLSISEKVDNNVLIFEGSVNGTSRSYVRLDKDCPIIARHMKRVGREKSHPGGKSVGEKVEAVRAYDEVRDEASVMLSKEEPSEAGPIGQAVTPDEINDRQANDVLKDSPSLKQEDMEIESCSPKDPPPDLPSSKSSASSENKDGVSIPLTEDMLNQLMRESMNMGIGDNSDPYDSDNESGTEAKEIVINHGVDSIRDGLKDHSANYECDIQIKEESLPNHTNSGRGRKKAEVKAASNCMASNSALQKQCSKKSNRIVTKRLSRSSQRYSSTDLYKPRPVLTQNSKRFRSSNSVLSEEVNVGPEGDQSKPSAKKKSR